MLDQIEGLALKKWRIIKNGLLEISFVLSVAHTLYTSYTLTDTEVGRFTTSLSVRI